MGISLLKVTWVLQAQSGGRIQVQIESRRFDAPAGSTPAAGVPVLVAAGRQAEGEFRCAECGYGVIVRTELPQCPMCRGRVWEGHPDNPFAPPPA